VLDQPLVFGDEKEGSMMASRIRRWKGRRERKLVARILVGVGIVLLVGVSLFGQAERDLEFIQLMIGDLRVEFHQRMIGEAIVEGDYIVRQYDANTGELTKEGRHWRLDLPEELPRVIDREEAEAILGGEIVFRQLYYIADGSDIHPVYTRNPCWIIGSVIGHDGEVEILADGIIDAVSGEFLGYAVPPPQYTGFSLTGPTCHAGCKDPKTGKPICTACCGAWTSHYQNAASWFSKMGYTTESVTWPTESKVRSHVQSTLTAVLYELAHGGSSAFASGCSGGKYYEQTTASEVKSWIASYPAMPFAFIGSCAGMCNTGPGSFSYEFRKGSSKDTATVGYCGMSGAYCSKYCWHAGYTVKWQDAFFKYCHQGKMVYQAFLYALADYPACAPTTQGWCMRFAGDSDLKIYPALSRQPLPEVRPELPDLRVLPKTIWDIIESEYLRLELWLKNGGELPIRDPLIIDFLLDGEQIHRDYGPTLPLGEEVMIPIEFQVPEGWHQMEIVLDPMNAIEEFDEENNTFVFEFEVGARPGAGGPCIGFEDHAAGIYVYSDVLFDAGAELAVLPFQWSSTAWTYNGFLDIGFAGLAGGSGQEAGTNNVNLGVSFPGPCNAVTFRFGEYGGNINLGVNGDFRNFENFADIHGTMIGGVLVVVTNGHSNDRGVVELQRAIGASRFTIDRSIVSATIIIGGQELWIDDICCE